MRRIQRYVLQELFWPLLASLLFFTVLMVVTQLFKETDLLLRTGVSGSLFFQLLGMLVVSLLTVTVPMAVLLATLIGFGRLASEREILAMRAAGLSLWTVFWPVTVAAGVLSLGLMVINAAYVPRLFSRVEELRNELLFQGLYNLQPGTFNTISFDEDTNQTLYYQKRDTQEGAGGMMRLRMGEVAMRLEVKQGDQQQETLIFSESGMMVTDSERKSLELVLENGTVIPINRANPYENTTLSFRRLSKTLSTKVKLDWERHLRELTLWDLLHFIQSERPDPPVRRDDGRMRGVWRDYYRLYNELIMRFSMPLACLCFVVVGMPLAVVVRPGAKTVSFILTFILMFLYYIVLSYGRELGERGNLMGWVLMVSPNIVMAVIGAILMRYMVRR